MAADLNRAKVLFDADRNLFREFMNSRSVFLGFPLAMIVDPDGTVVERIEAKKLDGIPPPSQTDLQEASIPRGALPLSGMATSSAPS